MLDLAKVRAFYFDPPPPDPGRRPTREELYAEAERRAVRACLDCGKDPKERGLGEHGSLIGGPGKPLRLLSYDPERRLHRTPLPLSWFDRPEAREPSTDLPDPGFFAGLSGIHLGGVADRPSGTELECIFRSADPSRTESGHLWGVFACMRRCELPSLLSLSGLSLYEIARAVHLSGTTRGDVIRWLNQFGARPPEEAPQDSG